VSLHGDLACNGPAKAALASLPELHWHPCPHVAGIIASFALSLLCPCLAGIDGLVAPALPPASQTGVCPVPTQLGHISVREVVAILLVIARGFAAVLGIVHCNWAFG
jgi:hypothetical protein